MKTVLCGANAYEQKYYFNREFDGIPQSIKDELCLLTYGTLACLKGLKEQGCNGPVTEAIGKIEKHINQSAHGQKD